MSGMTTGGAPDSVALSIPTGSTSPTYSPQRMGARGLDVAKANMTDSNPHRGGAGAPKSGALAGYTLSAATSRGPSTPMAGSRPKRVFKEASGDFMKRTAFLILPVVAILGWLVFLVVRMHELQNSIHDSADRMAVLQQANSLLREYVNTVADALAAPNASTRGESVVEAMELDRQVVLTIRTVVLGGSLAYEEGTLSIGPMSPDSSVDAVFHRDACVDEARAEACRQVEEGTLAEGLFPGVMMALSIGRKIVAAAKAATGEGDLLSPERVVQLGRLHTLESVYLNAATDYAVALLRTDSELLADRETAVMTTVGIVFVVVFIVFAFGYYWPMLEELATPIRSAHGLLTIIPEDTIHAVPDLKATLRAIVTDSQMGERML